MGKAIITEAECHNRLKGRSLTLTKYAGKVLSNKSQFTCLFCGGTWCAAFNDVYKGKGCPVCSKSKKLTEEECHKRLDGRDLKMVKYGGGVHKKSIFKCLLCLEEWGTAFNHVSNGSNCPKCGKLKSIKSRSVKESECHNKLKDRDLSMTYYAGTGKNNKSTFECKKCNYIWSTSFTSVQKGTGCPKCSNSIQLSFNDCVKRLKHRRVELVYYDGKVSSNKSLFKCQDCSYTWYTKFDNVDGGSGCPVCAKLGFNPIKPAWIYILRINSTYGDCYGFGITNNIKERMLIHRRSLNGVLDQEYEPLYFDSGVDAQAIERLWKQSPHKVNIKISGFKTECVLVNPETTKMIFN